MHAQYQRKTNEPNSEKIALQMNGRTNELTNGGEFSLPDSTSTSTIFGKKTQLWPFP